MSNPNIAEIGKPYRWQPGTSGNPGGRQKKLPITERYQKLLETKLTGTLRAKVEEVIGEALPEDATFGDAIVLSNTLAALGVKTGASLEFSKEIRESVEGRSTQRLEIMDQSEAPPEEELLTQMRSRLFGVITARAKMYNMPMPALSEAAEEAGVELDIPLEKERE